MTPTHPKPKIKQPRLRKGPLAPNPDLWNALQQGRLLAEALTLFYSRVFADVRLAPFFANSTQRRAAEKQYSFLRDIITGSRQYIGDRPRNAHHWMVISDDLFDYRESLLMRSAEDVGITAQAREQLRHIDEVFRAQIVKDHPIPKNLGGVQMPLEGYERARLSIGCLCDDCSAILTEGTEVSYHVRTGETWCDTCFIRRREDADQTGTADSLGDTP